jgi:hypothetical protein
MKTNRKSRTIGAKPAITNRFFLYARLEPISVSLPAETIAFHPAVSYGRVK